MFKYCFAFLAFLFVFSCKNGGPAPQSAQPAAAAPLADFQLFYDTFHSDSLFQMEHIEWPLSGLRATGIAADSTSTMEKHNWQAEEWTMHRLLDIGNGEYDQTLRWTDETFVSEIVTFKNTNFGLERHFSKFNNAWHLVFYSEMHEMK